MGTETDEKVTQPEGTVETPPEVSKEDLQKEVAAKQEEILKLQQTVSRHADSEHKLKDQSEALASLHKRLDQQEEAQAAQLDYLEEKLGETGEEKPKTQTHAEKLEAQRKEREAAPKKGVDPNAQRFFDYCEDVDLHIDYDSFEGCGPLVKEALGEGRTFKEALKYVRDKVKASQGADVDKRAKEIAEGLVEQKLKGYGLTAPGAGGPTGGGKDLSGKSPMELAVEAYKEK